MKRPWLDHYPKEVPKKLNVEQYRSVLDVIESTVSHNRHQPAFTNMGVQITFDEVDRLSSLFACFLQHVAGVKKGDRVAIQMPNLLQYPVVLFGVLKAGGVVVNTNPLYTAREMKHQFKDSQAKVLIVLANFAHLVEEVLDETSIETVVVTELGDMLGLLKGSLVNAVVKHFKKMVPKYNLPKSWTFNKATQAGRSYRLSRTEMNLDDLAFLQYTGGTTGVAKGAMLTHRNVLSNMEQIVAWMRPKLSEGQEVVITALPLYHIFSLTVNCLAFMRYGALNVLITNPKDIPAFIKELKKWKFTCITGVNTLFNALMNHPEFKSLDFSSLKISVAGAMSLQKPVALRWMDLTKTTVVEGYGLTEASPVLCCNPIDGTDKVGTIGLPLPETDIQLLKDDDTLAGVGETGELCAKGPQVMKGYWNQLEESKKIFTKDGWLRTGDIAVMDENGNFKIVDRKKDMILVSGFNVYPNEVEEVCVTHPKVMEAAAIGVPDEKSGEVVKVVIVKRDPSLTANELIDFCRDQLSAYKIPKFVEFRTELPKTNVGKILRRALREPKNT